MRCAVLFYPITGTPYSLPQILYIRVYVRGTPEPVLLYIRENTWDTIFYSVLHLYLEHHALLCSIPGSRIAVLHRVVAGVLLSVGAPVLPAIIQTGTFLNFFM
jgi:hypothetical protein